jgi:hypothetical protein
MSNGFTPASQGYRRPPPPSAWTRGQVGDPSASKPAREHLPSSRVIDTGEPAANPQLSDFGPPSEDRAYRMGAECREPACAFRQRTDVGAELGSAVEAGRTQLRAEPNARRLRHRGCHRKGQQADIGGFGPRAGASPGKPGIGPCLVGRASFVRRSRGTHPERSVRRLLASSSGKPALESSSEQNSKQGEPGFRLNRTRAGSNAVTATARASKLASAILAGDERRLPASRESTPASLAEHPSCEGFGALFSRFDAPPETIAARNNIACDERPSVSPPWQAVAEPHESYRPLAGADTRSSRLARAPPSESRAEGPASGHRFTPRWRRGLGSVVLEHRVRGWGNRRAGGALPGEPGCAEPLRTEPPGGTGADALQTEPRSTTPTTFAGKPARARGARNRRP